MSTVGQYFESVAIRGINEGVTESDVVQSMNATPADGSLTLPVGETGSTGPQGPPAAPIRWEGDISDPVALAALTEKLRPQHAGKTWRVLSTNTIMYWNGAAFEAFVDGIGGHGPVGAANALTLGTVTTGAAGTDLLAEVTGSSPAQTLNLTVPRGIKGRQGPPGGPGPIRGASDYAELAEPVDGAVIMWDSATSQWKPVADPGWRGPWTIAETLAWDGGAAFSASASAIGTTPNTIAIVNVPAQDVAWRPVVFGGVQVKTSNADTRVDLEARIGSAAGQIVALGGGLASVAWWYNLLVPQMSVSAMTPASSTGVIAAGASAAIYIVLRRNTGSNNYSFSRTYAHVAVWAAPVTGMP